MAGGIAIATGNFYTTGDRVKIGGITDDVINIGVLRTILMECGPRRHCPAILKLVNPPPFQVELSGPGAGKMWCSFLFAVFGRELRVLIP